MLSKVIESPFTAYQTCKNSFIDRLWIGAYNYQRMKIKWMRNLILPTWEQQYFAKNDFIFFVRSIDASRRAVFFSCRSSASAFCTVSEFGERGALSIRRFASSESNATLFEFNDVILLELLNCDVNDRVRFDCLSLSGGEIEASKRKRNDRHITGTIIYDQLPVLVVS
jgi:hypothetical protein